jgi:hypothetical protein
LTASDAAAGFTGGVVTQIDETYLNVGRTWVNTIDLRADYRVRLGLLGSLRLYGSATWTPTLRRRYRPDLPAVSYVGFENGALRWRGNLGIDWDCNPVALGLNAQYYAHYHAVDIVPGTTIPDPAALQQAGVRVSAQFYLDFSAVYRVALHGGLARSLDFRLGIENLLDHAPPVVTDTALGYSFFGDPRRRRVELAIAAHF